MLSRSRSAVIYPPLSTFTVFCARNVDKDLATASKMSCNLLVFWYIYLV